MDNDDGKPFYDEQGFLQFNISGWISASTGHNSFNENSLRKKLREFWEPETSYLFFKLFPNPEAAEELEKNFFYANKIKKGERKGELDWKVSKRKPINRKLDEDVFLAKFDRKLVDFYLGVLNVLNKDLIDKENLISFNVVNRDSYGIDYLTSFWPTSFAIKNKGDSLERFYSNLKDIHSPKFEGVFQEKDNDNYSLSRINVLKKREINPFLVSEDSLNIDSETFKGMINFMNCFEVKHHSNSSAGEFDKY